jgi:hypothetical protein
MFVAGGVWTCSGSGSGSFGAADDMVELLWAFRCIFWFREIGEGEMVPCLMFELLLNASVSHTWFSVSYS